MAKMDPIVSLFACWLHSFSEVMYAWAGPSDAFLLLPWCPLFLSVSAWAFADASGVDGASFGGIGPGGAQVESRNATKHTANGRFGRIKTPRITDSSERTGFCNSALQNALQQRVETSLAINPHKNRIIHLIPLASVARRRTGGVQRTMRLSSLACAIVLISVSCTPIARGAFPVKVQATERWLVRGQGPRLSLCSRSRMQLSFWRLHSISSVLGSALGCS